MRVSLMVYPPRLSLTTISMDAVPCKGDIVYYHPNDHPPVKLHVACVEWYINDAGEYNVIIIVDPVGSSAATYIQQRIDDFYKEQKQ